MILIVWFGLGIELLLVLMFVVMGVVVVLNFVSMGLYGWEFGWLGGVNV